MKNIYFPLVVIFLSSCVSNSKYNELKNENDQLRVKLELTESELNEYKTSPSVLWEKALNEFKSESQPRLLKIKEDVSKYHPTSLERVRIDSLYAVLLDKIEKKEALEKAEKERKEKEKNKTLDRLKKNYDDVSGIIWYENPYFVHYNNVNKTSIYLGVSGNTLFMRLKMSYSGSDWIFFEHAYLSYDGKTLEIPFDRYSDRKDDNSGGEVWEWIDVKASISIRVFLRELVASQQPKMRLSGKYSKTRNLSSSEIKAIKDVLAGFDILSEKYKAD